MTDHTRGLRPSGDLKIVVRSLSQLKPNPRNARTHSRRQIRQIADSIEAFGFNNPDPHRRRRPHHRRARPRRGGEAARPDRGADRLPRAHERGREVRAYVIADNRLGRKCRAGTARSWPSSSRPCSRSRPISTLPSPVSSSPRSTYIIGTSTIASTEPDALDEVELPSRTLARHPAGRPLAARRPPPDVRRCDPAESYSRLLDGRRGADGVHRPALQRAHCRARSRPWRVQHREFADGIGGDVARPNSRPSSDRPRPSAAYSCRRRDRLQCMDWRHLHELLGRRHARRISTLKNLCVWVKNQRRDGHLLPVAARARRRVQGRAPRPHINNVELGQHGRQRTNVWTYPGVNTFGAGRDAALAMHPTVKPVALVADAIRDCSKRNGLILDPFLGSGTTVIAAEITGRRAAGLELDPRYVDCAIRRWQRVTGEAAVLGRDRRELRGDGRRAGRSRARRWPMAEDYEVGYGKPPQHTRFKKGHSGHPAGGREASPNVTAELKAPAGHQDNDQGQRRRSEGANGEGHVSRSHPEGARRRRPCLLEDRGHHRPGNGRRAQSYRERRHPPTSTSYARALDRAGGADRRPRRLPATVEDPSKENQS